MYHEQRDAIHRNWLAARQDDELHGTGASSLAVIAALQDALPFREVIIEGDGWRYKKWGADLGSYIIPPRHPELDHIIVIPSILPSDLLDNAVTSIARPDLNIVVMDTSGQQHDFSNKPWINEVGWYQLSSRITFTRVQNLMHRLAKQDAYSILGFMHDDGQCKDASFFAELLSHARQRFQQKVAIVFGYYDIVCAYNVAARDDVGSYDESFDFYCSDCDHHYRLKLRGWQLECYPDNGRVWHYGSSSIRRSDLLKHILVDECGSYPVGHYVHKWGGNPGEERFAIPFDLPQ